MSESNHKPQGAGHKKAFEEQIERPVPMSVNFDLIPAALQAEARFVLWRFEWRDGNDGAPGKWTKPPYNPASPSRLASVTDGRTWDTFAKARARYQDGGWDGIGFVLGGGWVGVDLDDVRHPVTGEMEPWAVDVIDKLRSYSDISPSGTGGKVICRASLHKGRKIMGVEVYGYGRYFTLTGQPLPNSPLTVEDRQTQVGELIERLDRQKADQDERKFRPRGHEPIVGTSPLMGDDEIVQRAGNARNGDAFRDLHSGGRGRYGSASEADLAFTSRSALPIVRSA